MLKDVTSFTINWTLNLLYKHIHTELYIKYLSLVIFIIPTCKSVTVPLALALEKLLDGKSL